MAKYVMLGLEGESRILVVDCDKLTVSEVDPTSSFVPGEVDDLQLVNRARKGEQVIKGVNLAIATGQRLPTADFASASSYPYTEPA